MHAQCMSGGQRITSGVGPQVSSTLLLIGPECEYIDQASWHLQLPGIPLSPPQTLPFLGSQTHAIASGF